MLRVAWLAPFVALWAASAPAEWDDLPPVDIPVVEDFTREAAKAREATLPIMVMFYSDYCGWCMRVEEEFLKPMIRGGEYSDRILFRRLPIDSDSPVTGFRGERTTPAAIAAAYGVQVTPTLLFLAPDGAQLAPKLVGMTTPDFYGGYLDDGIFAALGRLRGEPVRAAAAEGTAVTIPR